MKLLQTTINTAVFWFSLIISFIIFSSLGYVRSVFRKNKQPYLLTAGKSWARFLLKVNRIKCRTIGLENFDNTEQYIIASNHQSVTDILIALAIIPVPFIFLVKESLFKVPLFGYYMKKAGYLSVSRKNAKADYHMLKESSKSVVSIFIFPEGSRSRDGEMTRLKPGISKISELTNFKTVPMSIRGSINLMRSGCRVFKPGEVLVLFGSPISWNGDKSTYLSGLKATIENNLL